MYFNSLVIKQKQANKNIYMKIEFQNSVAKLSFLCRNTDIKIAWINPCKNSGIRKMSFENYQQLYLNRTTQQLFLETFEVWQSVWQVLSSLI